jgi:hypothetical protein
VILKAREPARSEEEDDGYDESPKSTMLPIICATLSSTFGSTRVGHYNLLI